MLLNTDIIFHMMEKNFTVRKSGPDIDQLAVLRPVFVSSDTPYEPYRTYIGRPDQFSMPDAGTRALFICVGGQLPPDFNSRQCCVMTLLKESDLLKVLNALTSIFDYFDRWEETLYQILERDASIIDMLTASVPILENPISLCNNQLIVQAVVGADELKGLNDIGPISEEFFGEFANYHSENIQRRVPFTYTFMGMTTYSINIYKQETYLGLITIGDLNRPISSADKTLFQHLFKFVSRAAEEQINVMSGQFITVKSIANDILNDISVKPSVINRITDKNPLNWVCAVVVPSRDVGSLSTAYFNSLFEARLERCFSLYHSPYIIICFPVEGSPENEGNLKTFSQLLKTLEMQAGVSNSFNDICKIRQYYRQAIQALETGEMYLGYSGDNLFHFKDIALSYMLKNCLGELPAEYVVSDNLMALWQEHDHSDRSSGAVDYWETLKAYLDNEMNTAKTSRQLYIHRTTLQTRLEKLLKTIELDTPEQRLYVRNCMYLLELLED